MKDEKSLLEEILDRKKSIKNGLLDNDENIFSSKKKKKLIHHQTIFIKIQN